MRFRTWPVVAIALSGLVLLVVASVVATRNKAQAIYAQLDQLHDRHRDVEARLRRLRGDVHLAEHLRPRLPARYVAGERRGIPPGAGAAPAEQPGRARRAHRRGRARRGGAPRQPADQARRLLGGLRAALRLDDGAETRRKPLLPPPRSHSSTQRRARHRRRDRGVQQRQPHAPAQPRWRATRPSCAAIWTSVLWASVLVGVLVAVVAVVRIRRLEGRAEEHRQQTADAETEMRTLSQQLVKAQEQERRHLSRELHDHVGQMLTALRMELGTLERARTAPGQLFADRSPNASGSSRRCCARSAIWRWDCGPACSTISASSRRSNGTRATVARRCDLRVDLTVDGALEPLPDAHRTCIYRVVQEALTNCARHASAERVSVRVVDRRASRSS